MPGVDKGMDIKQQVFKHQIQINNLQVILNIKVLLMVM